MDTVYTIIESSIRLSFSEGYISKIQLEECIKYLNQIADIPEVNNILIKQVII